LVAIPHTGGVEQRRRAFAGSNIRRDDHGTVCRD
jgi:hypothetical protein